jgi:hypothetical protein
MRKINLATGREEKRYCEDSVGHPIPKSLDSGASVCAVDVIGGVGIVMCRCIAIFEIKAGSENF